jgi:hypothetical protein
LVGDDTDDIDAATVADFAMANFTVNPLAFIPDGMTIDQGPVDRTVRTRLVVLMLQLSRFIRTSLLTSFN